MCADATLCMCTCVLMCVGVCRCVRVCVGVHKCECGECVSFTSHRCVQVFGDVNSYLRVRQCIHERLRT